MALTAVDRALLQRCLAHQPGAWNDFVDRFLGLIYHVIHHSAHLRSMVLKPEDTEDMAADILLQIVQGDYAILRQFRHQSSLATYSRLSHASACMNSAAAAARDVLPAQGGSAKGEAEQEEAPKPRLGLENLEEVEKLLNKLPSREREIVRLYYLEGRTYEEISTAVHVPVNSIGPILLGPARNFVKTSRARPGPPQRSAQIRRELAFRLARPPFPRQVRFMGF